MNADEAHCDALWIAVARCAAVGPQTTVELLENCICWGHLRRPTRKVYLLRALHEAEELGLLVSRTEVRMSKNGHPWAHLVWEVTEAGRHESAELEAEIAAADVAGRSSAPLTGLDQRVVRRWDADPGADGAVGAKNCGQAADNGCSPSARTTRRDHV